MHITKTTLDYLDGKFEVEPGNGGQRSGFLGDNKIETYLIVPPKVNKSSSLKICFKVKLTLITRHSVP